MDNLNRFLRDATLGATAIAILGGAVRLIVLLPQLLHGAGIGVPHTAEEVILDVLQGLL
jgi:hypothetical protein